MSIKKLPETVEHCFKCPFVDYIASSHIRCSLINKNITEQILAKEGIHPSCKLVDA